LSEFYEHQQAHACNRMTQVDANEIYHSTAKYIMIAMLHRMGDQTYHVMRCRH